MFEEGYRWQIAHPGKYGGGTGPVREISETLRMEREIQEQAAELAASRERTHLAQELHDSVTQALFSMTLTAGAARILLEQQKPGVEAKLDELSDLAREALVEMRSLLFELRPGSVAEEGLVPALRKHLAAVQGSNRLGDPTRGQP